MRANGLSDEPQYKIIIDREKASAYGLSIADINATRCRPLGVPEYIGDFIDRGRVKRVYVEGEARSRMLPDDLASWYVRNSSNDMIPFAAFASGRWTYGPPQLTRYNGVSSIELLGQPAPGVSTGQAMNEMERLAQLLPHGIGYSWTGLSYEERASGSQAIHAYGLAMVVTFLCLAALYESWTIPVAVLLVVPLGIIGAVAATFFRGLENDIYFQVGLLVTIGLSAKNAILIIEFAKLGYDGGLELKAAAIEAARGAAAADPDDLAGLHPRRTALSHRDRRRFGVRKRHRHRRRRRHAQRHFSGDLSCAGLLRRDHGPL